MTQLNFKSCRKDQDFIIKFSIVSISNFILSALLFMRKGNSSACCLFSQIARCVHIHVIPNQNPYYGYSLKVEGLNYF